MNHKKELGIALGVVAYIGVNVVDFIRIHRKSVQERKLIRENANRQINAIWYAGGRVQEKIAHGDYSGMPNPIEQIRTDSRFYETAFLEDHKDE